MLEALLSQTLLTGISLLCLAGVVLLTLVLEYHWRSYAYMSGSVGWFRAGYYSVLVVLLAIQLTALLTIGS